MSISLFDLSGRLALVTGSSQGIGHSLAIGLARAGAKVVLNGRDEPRVRGAADDMRAEGLDVVHCAFDVTDLGSVSSGIKRIEETFGAIDVLINNAGIQRRAPLEDYPAETWAEIMRANVDSVFFVGQAVARGMIARGRGKIINIASVQSELARPGIAPYAATKGAIKQLTKGMCTDWARHGLQVNAIAPGYFRTELNQALADDPAFSDWLAKRTPAGRWGEVPELIGAAVFLASDASSFVNGHILYVDGGITACL